jgi:aerobic-type carbon monoxide dehydrogenase small subunit (CoxS/CutS family)
MERLSRRLFLHLVGWGVALASIVNRIRPAWARSSQPAASPAAPSSTLRLTVNGTERELEVEDRWTLVEVLRDKLQLTGTKIGCDRGECGACTVLLDGKTIYSCSYLAIWAHGKEVTTVEGLDSSGSLDELQQAFIEHDAPQCGFCTSGQLMAGKALLAANSNPTSLEVRQALAGNLCRCSNYNHYVDAVLAAARKGADRG